MIDLHAHIDLCPEPSEVVKEIERRKMYVLSVTTTPSAWTGTYSIAKHYSRIKTALGLHPQIAHERISELPLFDTFINETDYVGEVGLDGSPEFVKYKKSQLAVLKHILKSCGNSGGKIISLHSRRAASDVIDILDKYPDAGIPVFHWFTGGKGDLKRAIQRNAWFSVGPAMLNSKRSIEMVEYIPKDRILTESDGPFAKISGKPLMPWDVELAVVGLSRIWDMAPSEANEVLFSNFRTLIASK
ncbi:Qat anti-phage system TatD family nuclease QatD [Vreelandella titanicae]|uniref:Qat anti-phage system TatD family nuclease QatD n=1 Tax=Vreelandella titanicae TaxID=664683 RepID=UPI0016805006|nr:Qat anti-phage system TatD family nuclease QatD [Halomonas titanicae]QNU60665.1 TatD family hydrolase [Halomonas titanicae]|tara:strand:- start:148 stop:879 length:732 start_codon:yes stop_codon:yes gene_type:complete